MVWCINRQTVTDYVTQASAIYEIMKSCLSCTANFRLFFEHCFMNFGKRRLPAGRKSVWNRRFCDWRYLLAYLCTVGLLTGQFSKRRSRERLSAVFKLSDRFYCHLITQLTTSTVNHWVALQPGAWGNNLPKLDSSFQFTEIPLNTGFSTGNQFIEFKIVCKTTLIWFFRFPPNISWIISA